ncbi:MAG: glycoside hydrolase family 65 protein [Bradyrhizobium sp.]|nr:glycoside hydrolase family 65 [Pseudomonadota bacterium]MDE2469583.1 glycoside hydrolase family 65 protein [Bradyrhizobium sp.]
MTLSDCPADFSLSPTADPSWLLVEDGVNPAREREIDSLLAICNGYLGMRASAAEGISFSYPSTFIAGLYVTNGGLGPRLAVLPHLLCVDVTVQGEKLSLAAGRALLHRRQLDLRQGILWTEWRQQDPSGRITRLTSLELTSLADRHVMLQSVAITAENYAGRISLTARTCPLDMASTDIEQVAIESDALLMRIPGNEIGIAKASEVRSLAASFLPDHETGPNGREERWSWEATLSGTIRFDRIFTIFTSRDVGNPAKAARDHLTAMGARSLQTAAAAHVDAWHRRWENAEIRITGDNEAQRALRFAIYHLIAAANPADEHVSIGARGLTGEAYRGHIFWDTEIFMLPFYVFTDPPAARALLMYRYHTLDAARRKAVEYGYEGALYAWESADSGDETTPTRAVMPDGRVIIIRTGEREHHISADVAYAVWQYWHATGDDAFMLGAGAEILVETARFWRSRAKVGLDDRAHIRQAIGPDEYHELVDDNAYTNAMAAFNLECAADVADGFQRAKSGDWQRLSARLGLAEKEPNSWRTVAEALVTGFDPATRLFEQFAGYFQLEEIDVAAQRGRAMPIDMDLGPERVRRSKAIKQADVVALSALLWDKWPVAVHEANFRYYEPRTAHGSSLSPALYSLVAAKLGDRSLAQTYFRQAAEIDLSNNMGNAAGGVHMGALGGLWQATVFGIAGLSMRENGIVLDPHLLPGWTELVFPLQWRGRSLRVHLQADPPQIELTIKAGNELTVAVLDGPSCRVREGQRVVLHGNALGWANWEIAQ